jgi:hypothetical protein
MTDRGLWNHVHEAAFGNDFATPPTPKIVVVSARYSGCYEGGLFVAIPVEDLTSAAFGEDVAASEWWNENQSRIGAGRTPSAALLDWYGKFRRAVKVEGLAP